MNKVLVMLVVALWVLASLAPAHPLLALIIAPVGAALGLALAVAALLALHVLVRAAFGPRR